MERGDRGARPTAAGKITSAVARPAPQGSPRKLIYNLIVGAMFLVVLHTFVVQISVVRGHSMEPSLWDGDRLLVDRVCYSIMDVKRFDVVVLRYPVDPTIDFVKRIVGLPGDRIRIEHGSIKVNGRPVRNAFKFVPDRAEMAELLVPHGQYFVLGDNRPISCDSREFGLVPASFLKGKVRARFWPLARAQVFP